MKLVLVFQVYLLYISLPMQLFSDVGDLDYTFSREKYLTIENSFRVKMSGLEFVIPTQIGPRILHFSRIGEENIFKVMEDQIQNSKSKSWLNFGGHRLWRAPEDKILTYSPENSNVEIQTQKEFISISKVDSVNQILKEIEISPIKDYSIQVKHKITNLSDKKQTLSVWALTVLPLSGKALIPLSPRGTHPQDLLPTDSVQLWAYTNLSDSIFNFKKNYILIEKKENSHLPQKIGLNGEPGWAAYINGANVFIKKFSYKKYRNYPDKNSSIEVFVNQKFLELETLSPIRTLKPKESITHIETWILEKVPNSISTDDQLFDFIQTKIQEK
ncbi:MAG TPA: hypothetical protein PK079_18710 [Leptospiraceae bacterium]|nr:hypothetical protein [Leptospiraceae bacterium]HMX31952.1 hypothetical protein [Leptospiraceae bacterium]HMY33623.1 hypothetical protein [Leptospiraceae bacterium]HMZ66455.1 hypothetical protein [Leptospiraceae bacterium]HNA05314.1 hypothetical protein [Leptospiraceae bacterium]